MKEFNLFEFQTGRAFAEKLDRADPLRKLRSEFYIPQGHRGKECIYLTGNSLGLQPKSVRDHIDEELKDWAKQGVEGHFKAKNPWLSYHERLTDQTARLVGALPSEVVVMNTLTVNLHLMMVSFYRPTLKRYKILVEAGAFPSDQYAVASQARFHGYDPQKAIVELKPREGESILRTRDIVRTIEKQGGKIALVLLGSVNYLTGQAFDIQEITRVARRQGCAVGFDLAHGAGNLRLQLHDWGPDFAIWCGYKYLNGGPGALSGCFVHERHSFNPELPRFEGWWGHDKASRFKMPSEFKPIFGAEGWQLSNPPIFQMAALRASLDIFDRARMSRVRAKSKMLTGYLEYLLDQIPGASFTILTPRLPKHRGAQLSLKIKKNPHELLKKLSQSGVVCDFREPDVIRVAPVALYNRFTDVHRFAEILARHAKS